MIKSKFLFVTVVALLMAMVIIVMPISTNAQTAKMPTKMLLIGTVNCNFDFGQETPVNCYFDLKLINGQVVGCTSYSTELDGSPAEVIGTYKAKKGGIYYLDVYIPDNGGRDFEGTYNPKTGVFTGNFSARGLTKSYPFRFTLRK